MFKWSVRELKEIKLEIEAREKNEKEYFLSLGKIKQEKLINQQREIIWELERKIMDSDLAPIYWKIKYHEIILKKYEGFLFLNFSY